ncbi:DUF6221 family protein [Nocardioides caricicola]|uniref:DUF6221 family protein n=1 Tax=Nocardioides caricicola TaxID=634770 RepID=A0ABW0N1Y0_9ACTN
MRDPMPFLLARLAEDDVVINDLVDQVQTLPLRKPPAPEVALVIFGRSDPSAAADQFVVLDDEHSKAFRARFEPRRLELDIECRRRIAHEHHEVDDGSCATCPVEYPCLTLRYLTVVYADHPAYDPEWHGADPEADDARATARERLDWIDEDRSIAELLGHDVPDDEIAAQLALSLTRVRRARADLYRLGGVVPETPEEVIARCIVECGDREAMIERLKTWPYTFGTQAPSVAEGGTTGSWDDVEDALFDGLLSRDEFDEIRAAVVFPPAAPPAAARQRPPVPRATPGRASP